MHRHDRTLLAVLLLGALTLTSLAGVMAQTQTSAGASPAPSPRAAQAETKEADKAGEETPKIVRWVCTDHLCGGCDGKCSRSGHVAVNRKGHCACTPTPGSKLDEAIRKAFEPHIKGS